MPVKNLAVEPETTRPNAPINQVAKRMREEGLGDLIVVTDDRPVGIVTDRDLAMAIAEFDDLSEVTAEAVMSPDPVTIHEEATAVELPETMADGGVRRIPVVDDDGLLVGIATLDDVVATTGEMLDDVATVIETQSRDYEPSS